ncbi:MAG TPA: zinc ribbon domain-containing protein [Ktedonobacteraceae bacterium]
MKCQVCQADLTAGATFCTNCGTPVSNNPNPYGGSPSSPNQGIAPTVLASSPTPPPPSDPYAPPPPANPYGAPPPANPYNVPSTSYGTDTPPPAAAPYGTPPAAPYGTPPAYNPNLAYGQPQYVPQQPQKKGPNGCVIAIIVVVALVVLIGGGIAIAANVLYNRVSHSISNLDATLTADAGTAGINSTPTTSTGGGSGVPNASQIDANAKANIFNIQTSDKVDSNYKPTHPTTSFSSSSTVYITYDHSSSAGYIIEKTYDDTGAIAVQSQTPHSVGSDISNGYLSLDNMSSGSYTTGVYWCTQSDCSDAALAQVLTFTVS